GEIGLSEHLDSGIVACCSSQNPDDLDETILSLWEEILQEVYSQEFTNNCNNIVANYFFEIIRHVDFLLTLCMLILKIFIIFFNFSKYEE
ncbi:MAG: hypothetical protein MUO21_00610, partial [Nitrososphaeraceae archaeon]|nr:hypothetical protein [Nitrososphaeraceae archaeon]